MAAFHTRRGQPGGSARAYPRDDGRLADSVADQRMASRPEYLYITVMRAVVRICRRSGVSCGRAAMIGLWRWGPGELAPRYVAAGSAVRLQQGGPLESAGGRSAGRSGHDAGAYW